MALKRHRGNEVTMKKTALLLAVLMVIGSMSGWAISQTVDNIAMDQTKSDLRPVQDAGYLLKAVNDGIDKGLSAIPVIKEHHYVLDPVRKVKNESIKDAKSIINMTWDAVTLKSHRE